MHMDVKGSVRFLEISGEIGSNKEREFKQTVQFVINQLPSECIKHSLTEDVLLGGRYVFYSLWLNENSMMEFMQSQEYLLIKGSFNVLGRFEKSKYGEIT